VGSVEELQRNCSEFSNKKMAGFIQFYCEELLAAGSGGLTSLEAEDVKRTEGEG